MPTFEKPCGRPECPVVISERGLKGLAKRIYCSRSCSALARMAAGWKPQAHLTPESYVIGGQKGGRKAGENRRRRKVLETVAHLTELIPAVMRQSLDAHDLNRIKLLMQRSYDKGYRRGYRCAWECKRSGRPFDAAQRERDRTLTSRLAQQTTPARVA